jgi:hypothetical protein
MLFTALPISNSEWRAPKEMTEERMKYDPVSPISLSDTTSKDYSLSQRWMESKRN